MQIFYSVNYVDDISQLLLRKIEFLQIIDYFHLFMSHSNNKKPQTNRFNIQLNLRNVKC